MRRLEDLGRKVRCTSLGSMVAFTAMSCRERVRYVCVNFRTFCRFTAARHCFANPIYTQAITTTLRGYQNIRLYTFLKKHIV